MNQNRISTQFKSENNPIGLGRATNMLALSLITLCLLIGILPAQVKAENASSRSVVVELFTSQGCSSCPKADRVFERLIKRPNVIALGFHVDYWDYLGWKDNMANANHSKRQRAYARFRGNNTVFTPQIIIDGTQSIVGQDEKAIHKAIMQQSQNLDQVEVKLWEDEKSLFIEIGASSNSQADRLKTSLTKQSEQKPIEEGTVWLALIKKSESVKILRGENRGKMMTYHNIVRELSPVGRWMGKKMKIRLPRKHWMERGSDGCAVFLQKDGEGGKGDIRGAAQLVSW